MCFRLCRAAAAGALALGSKAAMMAKSAGGASGLLKGLGALGVAGGAAAAVSTSGDKRNPREYAPSPGVQQQRAH
jgi:hypothetical protein